MTRCTNFAGDHIVIYRVARIVHVVHRAWMGLPVHYMPLRLLESHGLVQRGCPVLVLDDVVQPTDDGVPFAQRSSVLGEHVFARVINGVLFRKQFRAASLAEELQAKVQATQIDADNRGSGDVGNAT